MVLIPAVFPWLRWYIMRLILVGPNLSAVVFSHLAAWELLWLKREIGS